MTNPIYCSFCGKSDAEVKTLIAGPTTFICDECITLGVAAVKDKGIGLSDVPPAPIPMILHCPDCSNRHVDEDEFADRPHHTHACQHCGMVWRPAVVPTVGVRFLPGFKNPPKGPIP